MGKQQLKKKSKRQSTKHRVKVERKVRDHKRKLRKEAKKNPKNSKRKDPGVPNILPFKEQVIKEAVAYKEKKEQERLKKEAARKKARERLQNQKRDFSAIVKGAEKRQATYDEQQSQDENKPEASPVKSKSNENSRKLFHKEFEKVVSAADVVLEVLDARDPLGSRCIELEDAVRAAGGNKKLVLVLNKIDLVPKENVEAWLKHLRLELPAVPFKASTQHQRNRLTQAKVDYKVASEEFVKSGHCIGADLLMKLLRNYCHSKEISISVGVVGFPNAGKSSIINSLKRSKACDVGAVPGITRTMQTVQLDKHIKLLDSPGVVMANSPSDVTAVLRNIVKVESLDDPIPCVEFILSRCKKLQMMMHYNIADYSDTNEFLTLLAHRMGKLRKGGVPDVNRAGRGLLQDWNSGKIAFYTRPPLPAQNDTVHIEASIVKDWGKEFNIDELLAEEKHIMEGMNNSCSGHMLVSSIGPLRALDNTAILEEQEDDPIDDEDMGQDEDEDTDEDMGDDIITTKEVVATKDLGNMTVTAGKSSKKKNSKIKVAEKKQRFSNKPTQKQPLEKMGGLITKKSRKLAEKKEKKKKKRADGVSGKLSDALTSAFIGLGGSVME